MIAPDKIAVIFLVYGDKHISSGIGCIQSILSRMFKNVAIEYLVVDNSLPVGFVRKKKNYEYIGGDNSLWEFSGWDLGYTYLKQKGVFTDTTLVLFANDTFHRRAYKNGGDFLSVFDKDIVQDKDVLRSAIGYMDDFPTNVSLNGISYNSWIRSNIFFLPYNIVEILYPLSITIDERIIFSFDLDKFWSDTDFISDNWKAYISSWLFGIENKKFPEYRLHWIKSEPLTSENHDFFRKKALCILSEHYLSARIHDLGIQIIDTNIFEKKPDRHISPYYL